MARSKHVHKFICVGRKGYESKIWKCALQDCTWFVHMGLSHVMLGKTSICWGCDEMFVIDENALKDDMPKCIDCRISAAVVPLSSPNTTDAPTIQRTPEQLREYEKNMKDIFGKDWRSKLG